MTVWVWCHPQAQQRPCWVGQHSLKKEVEAEVEGRKQSPTQNSNPPKYTLLTEHMHSKLKKKLFEMEVTGWRSAHFIIPATRKDSEANAKSTPPHWMIQTVLYCRFKIPFPLSCSNSFCVCKKVCCFSERLNNEINIFFLYPECNSGQIYSNLSPPSKRWYL